MKMAQVSRAICRGLRLNQDFAEAVALGAKVGSVPFVHAAKDTLGRWAERHIQAKDRKEEGKNPIADNTQKQLELDFKNTPLPSFISVIKSSTTLMKVRQFMPWSAGQAKGTLYSSGQEGYWLLCMNPFLAKPRTSGYLPETMYGIWRHTFGERPGKNVFLHRCEIHGDKTDHIEITDRHATFEWLVVQYADDIAWVIENLNDANDVAILNKHKGLFDDVLIDIGGEVPSILSKALRTTIHLVFTHISSMILFRTLSPYLSRRAPNLSCVIICRKERIVTASAFLQRQREFF